jgi:mannose-6-phosphate isomerase-like protein (cupin superfamily)
MEALVNLGDSASFHIYHKEDESFLITEGVMVFYDRVNKIEATKRASMI